MKKNITVNFKIEFGSDFQKNFFGNLLDTVLKVLKTQMESMHKDNKIIYEINTHDGYKKTQY